MKRNKVWIAAGLVSALSVGTVLAESHADNPFAAGVKARQAHMQLYAFNLGILGAMAKGEAEYDAEAAALAANNIVHIASVHQPQAWAPGSDNSAINGTRALPALWQNFPDVGQKSKDLFAAAEAMKAVAGDGQQALGGAMGKLGAACSACHKAYRAPEN
ncbi:cytochrome c [Aliiroseovarius sp. KMU-50]|uniref:Cytochrome c n=1 Tax=Aliiroseovarius salicola TaxID=3009082 RepID=A0ABT4W4Y5_9RHOB|nr:cytochrome c [Aliiroseovarius sp. KMU-50]MDA5095587.1 cytochrome c [Aliiroseovarius sp. KMU-50]